MPKALPWVADPNLGIPRVVHSQRARKLRRRGIPLVRLGSTAAFVWYEHRDSYTMRINQCRIRRKLAVALRHAIQKYGLDWPRHLSQVTIGGNGRTVIPDMVGFLPGKGVVAYDIAPHVGLDDSALTGHGEPHPDLDPLAEQTDLLCPQNATGEMIDAVSRIPWIASETSEPIDDPNDPDVEVD